MTAGALCNEPTVVSDACRSPNNDVDRLVCDDPKMAGLQRSVWEATKTALQTIFSALIGGRR